MRSDRLGAIALFLAVETLGCGTTSRPPEPEKAEPKLTPRELFERKRECMEVGLRAYQVVEKSPGPRVVLMVPGFTYDAKRNTCLWHGGLLDSNTKTQMEWITDTFTNVEIASYLISLEKRDATNDKAQADFKKLKSELFPDE